MARPENLKKPWPMARAVFGGQVLGQALAAASQTVAPGTLQGVTRCHQMSQVLREKTYGKD